MLLLGLLFPAWLGQTPAPQPSPAQLPVTVTFESTGVSGKAFCSELSRQTGQRFEARDDIQTKLLAIRLKAVPLTDVLSKLTYVTRAKLVQDGGARVLIPDEVSREAMRRAAFERRVAVIKDELSVLRPLLRDKPMDEADARSAAKQYFDTEKREKTNDEAGSHTEYLASIVQKWTDELRFPAGQALVRMLMAVPPEELATISDGRCGVWSTNPTPVERRTSLNAQNELNHLNQDREVWSQELQRLPAKPEEDRNYAPVSIERDLRAAVGLIQVSTSDSGSLLVEYSAYDSEGRLVANHLHSCDGSRDMEALKREPIGEAGQPVTIPVPTTIHHFLKCWCDYGSEQDFKAMESDPGFLAEFFQPEKFDPIANTYGWLILALAEKEGKNLIATEESVDDKYLQASYSRPGEFDLRRFKKSLKGSGPLGPMISQFFDDERWITCRTSNQEIADRDDFDRAALGQFLRIARDTARITVMDVASYAASTIRTGYFNDGLRSLEPLPTLIPGLKGMSIFKRGGSLFALLGRMTELQRRACATADGLPLEALSPAALAAVMDEFEFANMVVGGQTHVYRSNFTDGIPNGLPGSGVLRIAEDEADNIYATFGDGKHGFERDPYFSPEKLAHRMAPQAGEKPSISYDLHSLQLNHRTTYKFMFSFPGNVTYEESIIDDEPTGPVLKSIDDLPADLRDRVKAALAKEKSGAG